MAGTNTHYTIREAKAILAQHGMTIKSVDGEYRVAFKGPEAKTEASAYYATNLLDAIGTGIDMARARGDQARRRRRGRLRHGDRLRSRRRNLPDHRRHRRHRMRLTGAEHMTSTQLRTYEMARRRLADANMAFMEMVTHPTNPMTREDLTRLIALRPDRYSRFSGWLTVLPSRNSIGA
ncbi:hypothetical protein [Bradyrhizobium sp. 2S1]|uniref:hypothetical protein n=1 Tax=Bradyrhizobium sp. 2S1 TaxID=1404429 RepID=UPI00140DFA31|nr:hypothetical protein [Bradyrhizobium sp. 2S1]MCK7669168.1 hypothetical protein [Bradyrhizobium sp. 2S1]